MAYTHYDVTKPDPATQNVTQGCDSMRSNERALCHAVVMGSMPYWNVTPSGGSAEQPAVITHSNGTQRVRETITYGTTGGAAGNVTQVVVAYSSNSGGTWDGFGTMTIAYDAAGNVTGITWA